MTAANKCLWVFSSFDESAAVARFAAVVRATRGRTEHQVISLDGEWSGEALSPASSGWSRLDLPVRRKGLVSISSLWAVRRALSEEKPDLVVTSNGGALEWLMVNRGPGSAPHIHMEDPVGPTAEIDISDRNRNWARRRAFPGRRRLFVTGSEAIEAAFAEHWGVPAGTVRRVGYGAPEALFDLPPAATQDGEPVVFGAVADGAASAGLYRLLDLVATLRERGRNARAVIFGAGAMSAELKASAERLGLGDGFVLRPLELADTSEVLPFDGIDVYAALAGTEADMRGVVNAMAAARPVLAANSDATASALCELNRMFMRAGDDASALAAAGELLCVDPSMRRSLGEANRARAATMFSEERMAARFESVMDEFLGAPAPLMLPAPDVSEPEIAEIQGATPARKSPELHENPVAARTESAEFDASPSATARIALPAPVDIFEISEPELAPTDAKASPQSEHRVDEPVEPALEKPYRRRSAAELTREVLARTRGDLFRLGSPTRAKAG